MDIDLLSKMVKELILDNDKVVLPGLGAFVAEIVPATFSDRGYTINPPYRKLYFRPRPDEGQELIQFYATSNNIDYQVADKIIRDFVAEMKTVLLSKKVVLFPGLGRLRATKENALFFVADEELDIYPDGVGLEPISLKTHQETKEEVEAAVVELKALVEPAEAPAEAPAVEEPAAPAAEEPAEAPAEPEVTAPVQEPTAPAVPETPAPAPAPAPASAPAPAPVPAAPAVPAKKATFGKVMLAIFLTAAALLLLYIGVSRLMPGVFDSFLYTTEELEILNQ